MDSPLKEDHLKSNEGLFSDNYEDDYFKDGASNNKASLDKSSLRTPVRDLSYK